MSSINRAWCVCSGHALRATCCFALAGRQRFISNGRLAGMDWMDAWDGIGIWHYGQQLDRSRAILTHAHDHCLLTHSIDRPTTRKQARPTSLAPTPPAACQSPPSHPSSSDTAQLVGWCRGSRRGSPRGRSGRTRPRRRTPRPAASGTLPRKGVSAVFGGWMVWMVCASVVVGYGWVMLGYCLLLKYRSMDLTHPTHTRPTRYRSARPVAAAQEH